MPCRSTTASLLMRSSPRQILGQTPAFFVPTNSTTTTRSWPCRTNAQSQEMLSPCQRLRWVCCALNPASSYNIRQKRLLSRRLSIVNEHNPSARCEIHYRYQDDKPANAELELERESVALFGGIIPYSISVSLFCWKERRRTWINLVSGSKAEGDGVEQDGHKRLHLLENRVPPRYHTWPGFLKVSGASAPII